MYIKFLKGKTVKCGRCFRYYKCGEFTIYSLYFFHIRICPDKETYDNMPKAGQFCFRSEGKDLETKILT